MGAHVYVSSMVRPAGQPSAITLCFSSSSSGAGTIVASSKPALRATSNASFLGTPPVLAVSSTSPPTTTCRLGLHRPHVGCVPLSCRSRSRCTVRAGVLGARIAVSVLPALQQPDG
jgi:hypothetical protein